MQRSSEFLLKTHSKGLPHASATVQTSANISSYSSQMSRQQHRHAARPNVTVKATVRSLEVPQPLTSLLVLISRALQYPTKHECIGKLAPKEEGHGRTARFADLSLCVGGVRCAGPVYLPDPIREREQNIKPEDYLKPPFPYYLYFSASITSTVFTQPNQNLEFISTHLQPPFSNHALPQRARNSRPPPRPAPFLSLRGYLPLPHRQGTHVSGQGRHHGGHGRLRGIREYVQHHWRLTRSKHGELAQHQTRRHQVRCV